MKIHTLCQRKDRKIILNKISDEDLRLEIREGIKEAIVDLCLFEPDLMTNFFKYEQC